MIAFILGMRTSAITTSIYTAAEKKQMLCKVGRWML
jgi:hypothetical protein